MSVRVSIILPTRNSIRYLNERIASIRAQTLTDWEVVAVDTSSSDGTLDVLRTWAAADARVRLFDVPPGLYQAFNFGIRQARGEFVYIATSDDTMAPDALARMVAALDAHPDCGLCDTRLMEIDGEGRELTAADADFLPCFGHFCHPRDTPHVRLAPFDFFQQCGGKTIYTSLTQILTRRRVFDEVGLFPENYGPSADYMWGLRVGLRVNVVYLPAQLATWRIHASQQTGHDSSFKNFQLMLDMAEVVLGEITDERLKAAARRIRRLLDLKTGLLPIKRFGSLHDRVQGLCWTFSRQPALFARFMCIYFVSFLTTRKRRRGIAAYDALLRQTIRPVSRAYFGARPFILPEVSPA